jgi:hypothetical protein
MGANRIDTGCIDFQDFARQFFGPDDDRDFGPYIIIGDPFCLTG